MSDKYSLSVIRSQYVYACIHFRKVIINNKNNTVTHSILYKAIWYWHTLANNKRTMHYTYQIWYVSTDTNGNSICHTIQDDAIKEYDYFLFMCAKQNVIDSHSDYWNIC
jgi:hypothetical protein